jgi:ribose transport system permease protein
MTVHEQLGRKVADGFATRALLRRVARRGLHVFGLTSFLLGIVVYFASTSDAFLTRSNLITILSNVAVIGIVSIGQTFAIISGGFDLSVSGTVPLAAVIYAKLVNGGVSLGLAMAGALAAGAVVGIVNGLIIAKFKINPLITTLGTLSITGGLALAITNGLTESMNRFDAGFLAEESFWTIPRHVWALVALAIAGVLVLRYTIFGRALYSMGGNREASWLAGMRVDVLTVAVYAVCATLASFAGIILAMQLLAGSASLGNDSALTSIAAVILGGGSLTGGIGGVVGTLTGVLVLGTLSNGMAIEQVSAFYQQIATGVILLVAVGFSRLRTVLGGE